MINGATVNIGGTDFIVPPLTLGAVQRLMPQIELMSKAAAAKALTAESLGAVIAVVQAALVRNYPELGPNEVAELIDMKSMPAVIQAVLGVSGFEKGSAVLGGASGQQLTGI